MRVWAGANFRNEITWKRTHAHGSPTLRYGPVHDVILFYTKSDSYLWTNIKGISMTAQYIKTHFSHVDSATGRRFQPITLLTGSGVRQGRTVVQPWRNIDPTRRQDAIGRLPGHILEKAGMPPGSGVRSRRTRKARSYLTKEAGMVYWSKRDLFGGKPRLKWYADQLEGVARQGCGADIPPIS